METCQTEFFVTYSRNNTVPRSNVYSIPPSIGWGLRGMVAKLYSHSAGHCARAIRPRLMHGGQIHNV
eukprot:m.407143 g.407143  ORF g.407143 m.407143 type:complete len:67 (-) comp21219_c0_seq7:1900-2100(-)